MPSIEPPGGSSGIISTKPRLRPSRCSGPCADAPLPVSLQIVASSAACPVQAFRVGSNVYVTQFTPSWTPPESRFTTRGYFTAYQNPTTTSSYWIAFALLSMCTPPRSTPYRTVPPWSPSALAIPAMPPP